MAAPQPDFPILAQSLREVAHELSLIPNSNKPLQNMASTLQEIQQGMHQLNQRVEGILVSQNLLPLRVHNATSPNRAPLVYPPNVVLPPGAPEKKQEILELDAQGCQALAEALGLPQLQSGAFIAARHQQIIEHLGAFSY